MVCRLSRYRVYFMSCAACVATLNWGASGSGPASQARAGQPAGTAVAPNDKPAESADQTDRPRRNRREASLVSRADLAASYLRFELALRAHPPAEERVAEVNQAFDRATLAFFGGKHAQTIRDINQLTASLLPQPPGAAAAVADALKVKLDPPVLFAGCTTPPTAKVLSMYAVSVEPAAEMPFRLQLRRLNASEPARELPFVVSGAAETKVELTLSLSPIAADLPPGAYAVEVAWSGGGPVQLGRWAVTDRSLEAARAENAARLDELAAKLPADRPELAEALASVRARNELLSDTPSESNTAQFLADPHRLLGELTAEIEALAAGRDPFRRRAGDHWRVVTTAKKPIPLRVHAPAAALGDKAVPLVVSLHGAGGDENMFLEGYGAGMIRELADRHGFLLASPATTAMGNKRDHLDRLIVALGHDYAIDRQRVYVLGHSMGGMTTAGLVANAGERIAAACCIAGSGGFKANEHLPPVLVIAGGLDMVVPVSRIEPGATKAIAEGLPIEYRLKPSYGHTVLVGAALPEVIDWLLAKR